MEWEELSVFFYDESGLFDEIQPTCINRENEQNKQVTEQLTKESNSNNENLMDIHTPSVATDVKKNPKFHCMSIEDVKQFIEISENIKYSEENNFRCSKV